MQRLRRPSRTPQTLWSHGKKGSELIPVKTGDAGGRKGPAKGDIQRLEMDSRQAKANTSLPYRCPQDWKLPDYPEVPGQIGCAFPLPSTDRLWSLHFNDVGRDGRPYVVPDRKSSTNQEGASKTRGDAA
jgi:hypothetical protein